MPINLIVHVAEKPTLVQAPDFGSGVSGFDSYLGSQPFIWRIMKIHECILSTELDYFCVACYAAGMSLSEAVEHTIKNQFTVLENNTVDNRNTFMGLSQDPIEYAD